MVVIGAGGAREGAVFLAQAGLRNGVVERTPGYLAEIEHERKQITVLFADIAGSTEFVAKLDPDDARLLLDPILDRMVAAVHFYQGTVHRLMGDGIMALFGAPVAYEDHALRACYSALRIQESIRKYAAEVSRERDFHLQVRVGLNSGDVAAGTRRGDASPTYSVNGQSVHVAARMEQLAMPGTVLMASQTFHLTDGYLETRYIGPQVVKGLAAPVETYELLGANATRSRLEVAASRGLSRFIGRHDELSQLRQAGDRVQQGRGELIAIVGEPGVGKSRLIREFIRTRSSADCRVLEMDTVSASYGSELSYRPITECLRWYFRVANSDDNLEVRDKVRAKLLNLGQKFVPLLSTLMTLLDFPTEQRQITDLASPQRGQSVLEAMRQLLFRESEIQPLMVIVEDLHSVDPDTQAVLNGLVDSLPAARILFVVSFRPDFDHSWGNKSHCSQIRVDPLDSGGARALFDGLVGVDGTLEPLKHLLIERTAGNPFFLEENVRSLVENGVLLGEPGSYTVAKAVSEISVPATVESLLASRIDRLHPADKRLLLSAAVIGYHVPLGVLEAISELPTVAVRQALERLQTSDFLHETSLFPDVEYTFRHALIHDVAYRTVSLDRRRILHTATLSAGERIYSTHLIEKSDWLAFHAFWGQQWDRAVSYFRTASAHAIRRAASRNAVKHLENALKAAGHYSKEERASIEIDLRIELRHALTPLGQIQETLENLAKAEDLAASLKDRPRLARIVSFTTNCLVNQARYAEALVRGERALAMTRELQDHSLDIATRLFIARARLARAEFPETVKILLEIIQALDEKLADDFLGLPMLPAAAARSLLAISLAQTGDFNDATAMASEAASRAANSRQPDSIIYGNWSCGFVAMLRGASEEAVDIFEGLRDLCRTHDLDAYTSRAIAGLGCARARLGQIEEGLRLLERAVAMDDGAEPMTTRSFALNSRAEALFLAGARDDAVSACNQTLQFTREHEEHGAEAYAHFLLGLIHNTRTCDFDAALNHIQAAASMASNFGMRPLLAHCDLALAELHRKRGNLPQACEYIERGHTMLNALEMKQWFELNRDEASSTRPRLSA